MTDTPTKIKKRNGNVVDFDISKISLAIEKAGNATGEFNDRIARRLATKVAAIISNLEYKENDIPTVEETQDIVEEVLLASPHRKTARAYILYRDQRARLREIKESMQTDIIDQYVGKLDWKVKENSNMTFSLQGLNNYIATEISQTYWLNKIYNKSIRDAHRSGDLHIHDLGILGSYCVGWDLYDLLVKGFRGVSGKLESAPPKHFRTALGQIVNFFYTLQGEAAGAQAFSNLDTLLAPFIAYDELDYQQVKQALQEFVFNLNVPTRTGAQTPFTNVTLDLVPPSNFADQGVIIGGKIQDKKYSEFQNEMDIFNKAFTEVMAEGDFSGRVFTFPIPTYNITNEFNWDNPVLDNLWAMTAKYGIPYFANYMSSDMDPSQATSMCCLDYNETILIRDGDKFNNIKIGEFVERYNKENSDFYLELENSNVTVMSYDFNTHETVFKPITGILRKSGSTEIVVYAGESEPYRGDPDHLDLIMKHGELTMIKLKDIKPGDLLVWHDPISDSLNTKEVSAINTIHHENPIPFYDIEVADTNVFILGNGHITHNCRLRIDRRELIKRGGGLFGAGAKTGSLGVVTINLPRLGYRTHSPEEFIVELDKLLNIAKDSLEIKRKAVEIFTENNLYPYTKFYLAEVYERYQKYWANHFSTIGILGMNEACINLLGCDITDPSGKDFALMVGDHIRNKLIEFQLETGNLYNYEATPAEGTSYRLAKIDKEKYPDIICANESDYREKGIVPYYTNSIHPPVGFSDDVFDILDHQDDLQVQFTGGTVVHLYAGEQISDPEVVKNLVKTVCTQYKLPYFSFTPTFSVCPEHGYTSGEYPECPRCGKKSEVYSRVVGYLRPISQWNDGKQAEWSDRKKVKVNFD